KSGLVKKTPLKDYDSPRAGGVIAINLREREDGTDDELIGAELVSADDDLLLVSKKAQSIRFTASDDTLRPMGRATSGVKGMSFREADELLSMNVVRPGTFVFTATDGGYAKRTAVDEYRVQGRGGLGIKAAKIVEDRGSLVGALIVEESDEILAITLSGGVIRTRVSEVRETGRDTMGVQLINLGKRDAVVGIARNAEAGREAEEVGGEDVVDETAEAAATTGTDEGEAPSAE
ncbi:DNA gyrase C-terminal beta-propeller domain-containing protein, partial [Streptomyces sp. SAS_269]